MKKKHGRPPKYVYDGKGKEVVGLSYNTSNGMFYITGSNPRIYLKTNASKSALGKSETYKTKRDIAIQQFNDWKKNHQLSKEQREQQIQKDIIYRKAKQLINDGHMDEYVYERAYDLITESPIDAALRLGLKNLIFLSEKNFYYPFTLDLVWELFKYHRYAKSKNTFCRYEHAWEKFIKDMKIKTLSGVTKEKLERWKEQLYQEYDDDQIIELLECLDVIFNNVLKQNYQSESVKDVVDLINDIYNQVS